jgi:hypothetical protein
MNQLLQTVQYLLDNGYMAIIKGKYIVTSKFNKEITGLDRGLTLATGNVPLVKEPDLKKTVSWQEMYTRFIIEAKVPARILNPRGDYYQANSYSEGGLKAFRKALEKEEVKYDLLVESTQLYYTGSIGLKVAIGRYMEEGMWRTQYQEIVEHTKAGTLKEHVKSTKDESKTHWKVG